MCRNRHIKASHTASKITVLLKHNPTRSNNSNFYKHDYHNIIVENTSRLLIDRQSLYNLKGKGKCCTKS